MRLISPLFAGVVSATVFAALTGCAGGSPNCTPTYSFEVSPLTGTASHSAAAPGNQLKFTGSQLSSYPSGCAEPAVAAATPLGYYAWTVSDPLDVTISSAQDSTNGLATCVNATAGAVTVTATDVTSPTTTLTKTASLTCQ